MLAEEPNWIAVMSGIVVPICVCIIGCAWKLRSWIDGLRQELRDDLAAHRREIDARLAVCETFMRDAPSEFTVREDFVRESVLLRRDVQSVLQQIAEIRGESRAALHIGQAVAAAVENANNRRGNGDERRA